MHKPFKVFGIVFAAFVHLGDAFSGVAAVSTQPEPCEPTEHLYDNILCISRTDTVTDTYNFNINLSNIHTYNTLFDNVVITRRNNDIPYIHVDLNKHHCCSECKWPRKKFYSVANSNHCTNHCLMPSSAFLFKFVNKKRYSVGDCYSQGYNNFMSSTPSRGIFSPASDVFVKDHFFESN